MSAETSQYLQFLQACPTGCLLIDSGGVVTSMNEMAIDVMGIPEDKLLGVPLGELLVPEFSDSWEALLRGASAKPASVTVRISRALLPLELTVKQIDANHMAVGVRSMENEFELSAKAAGDLTHDVLTGLPDHYHVLSELYRRSHANQPKPMALLCLWIDELAGLVTSHGDKQVERVVKESGERIKGKLRSPDLVGRFEKSGFLALLTSDADTDQITEIAERLRGEIAFPVYFDKKLVSFTTSVALTSVMNTKPSIEKLLALLEASGNRASTSGGSRTDILQL